MTIEIMLNAIFDSYSYNRSIHDMFDLCKEIIDRIDETGVKWTDDGDIIYGVLVLLYGDYGTSPRSGWIKEQKEKIKICINDIMNDYKEDI